MRAMVALLVALMLWPTVAEAQTKRALFVGINNYVYAQSDKYPDSAFKNLRGAVADTLRFKEAVQKKYAMDLDQPVQGNCTSANATSVTLLDKCATRAAILDALDKMIDQSAPRDTLLFYFAGHGSQYRDDKLFDQSSGYNGTILPTDARDPEANTAGDIFDRELKARKDRATGKGVYFISIFDSCNSGSATRDGADWQSRSVPPLEGTPPARPEPPATAPGDGHWVHLAAALDGEQAKEVRKAGDVGKYEGVFTNALIETINVMPYNSFGDIIREVQAKIAAQLRPTQTPVGEGELSASFGSDGRRAVVFIAKQATTGLLLDAGRSSGMTQGSLFALFASETDALKPGAVALASARIASVEDSSATLAFDLPPNQSLPARMVAIETAHAFGAMQLGVANQVKLPAERKIVQTALDGTDFISKRAGTQAQIAIDPARPGEAQLLASDGLVIGALGAVNDPGFAERLRGKLKKILRVQQLLALRTDPKNANMRFCIDDSEYPAAADACPPKEKRGNIRVLKRGERSYVTVQNEGEKPRYVYVFGIDPNYGVALIMPAPGGNDSKLAPMRAHRTPDDPVKATRTGAHLFVTVASDEPINAAAFEQDGTNARGSACSSALERLLCDANKGKTSADTAKVGNWTAIVETVYVE